MAQPQRRAEFFVTPAGVCFAKAPPLKERERGEFFDASDKHCALCDVPIFRLGRDIPHWQHGAYGQVDHIFARSRGGQNNPENLRLLCVSCNASKGAS